MPIIIVEGADGAGKTTLCMKYLDTIAESIYIHFPIRDMKKDIINKYTRELPELSLCDSLKNKSMQEIQDIILNNIVANTPEMLRLHNEGLTIIVDRYIYSNIVYRKLHNLIEASMPESVVNVLQLAKIIILTERIDVLYQRIKTRNEATNILDTVTNTLDSAANILDTVTNMLDDINEKKDNIEIANDLFRELSLHIFT